MLEFYGAYYTWKDSRGEKTDLWRTNRAYERFVKNPLSEEFTEMLDFIKEFLES